MIQLKRGVSVILALVLSGLVASAARAQDNNPAPGTSFTMDMGADWNGLRDDGAQPGIRARVTIPLGDEQAVEARVEGSDNRVAAAVEPMAYYSRKYDTVDLNEPGYPGIGEHLFRLGFGMTGEHRDDGGRSGGTYASVAYTRFYQQGGAIGYIHEPARLSFTRDENPGDHGDTRIDTRAALDAAYLTGACLPSSHDPRLLGCLTEGLRARAGTDSGAGLELGAAALYQVGDGRIDPLEKSYVYAKVTGVAAYDHDFITGSDDKSDLGVFVNVGYASSLLDHVAAGTTAD